MRMRVYQLAYFEKYPPRLEPGKPIYFVQDDNNDDSRFVAFRSLSKAVKYRKHYLKQGGFDKPTKTARKFRSGHRIVEMTLKILPDPEGEVPMARRKR